GTASPDIVEFIADPEDFLRNYVVSAEGLGAPGDPRRTDGYAKLVETEHGYDLKYHGSINEHNTAFAYYLGYNAGNQRSSRPAWVDIPKNVVEGTFLFTGTLSGCSVVVSEHPTDPALYRVFHDARLSSSLFYNNVAMAVDFPDYRFQLQGVESGFAAVLMQYKDGQWRLFVQLQSLTADGKNTYPTLRDMRAGESVVITMDPGSYDRPRNLERFLDYRERCQNEVLQFSQELQLQLDPTEDVFEPEPINLENGTFRRWEKLRKRIEAFKNQFNYSLESIEKKITQLADGTQKKYLSRLSAEIRANKEANDRKYNSAVLKESRDADLVWLWLEKKRVEGFDAVVQLQLDGQLRAGIETIGERYSEVELDVLRRTNTAFAEGFDNYESVDIPGFTRDMSSLESKRLFLQPNLSDRER
ncbi:hypothetical protein RUND412_011598, partial [Rhizina undulata]